MRKALIAALALAGAAILSTGSAEARNYRYCLNENNQPGPGTCPGQARGRRAARRG